MINPKHPYAIIRSKGLDDIVLSTHKTIAQAQKALVRLGGDPGPISQCGDRSLRVVSADAYEIIESYMGGYTVRPKF